jgi:hypothetical protein
VAYDKVFWKWVQYLVGVHYKLNISVWWHTRQLIRKDVRILTHYWNFIKRGDNGHIGTRVGTVLER